MTREDKLRLASTSNLTTTCRLCGSTYDVSVECPTCAYIATQGRRLPDPERLAPWPEEPAAASAQPATDKAPSDPVAASAPEPEVTERPPPGEESPRPLPPTPKLKAASSVRPAVDKPKRLVISTPPQDDARADRLLVLIGDACGSLRTCGAMLCAIAIAEKAEGSAAAEVQREARRLRELAEAIEGVLRGDEDLHTPSLPFSQTARPEAAQPTDSLEARLLVDLTDHGRSNKYQLAERLGISSTHVVAALHRLQAAGHVELKLGRHGGWIVTGGNS